MKKRILSALLVFCLACSLVGTAWAADGLPTAAPTATPDVSNVVTPDEPEDTTEGETANPATQSEGEGETDPTEAPADPTATPTASPEPSESPAPAATPDAEQPEVTPTPVPEQTATPAPEPTAAPTATPNGVVLEDGSVEYTAVLTEDEDEAAPALNVVVTAPAGAFGGDVNPVLKVSAIEDETQTDGIAAKLDESGLTYDGFAALDIRFVDADGNEIEPSEPVKVRIELPDSIVDSGIDLSTLAVQHLAEDEGGNVTSVDSVASVADGTIALSAEAQAAMEQAAADANAAAGIAPMSNAPAANNALPDNAEAAAVAEFEVSGFSKFTITWDTWMSGSRSITVECYDKDTERPLSDAPEKIELNQGEKVTFSQGNDDLYIEGYTFDSAVYQSGQQWKNLTFIQADYHWLYQYWSYSYDGHSKERNAPTIRLYYTKNEEPEPDPDPGDPDTPINATVTTGKSAVLDKTTGNYTLELSVSGDRGSSTNKQKVDVLFILDESNSMGKYWNSQKRITAAKSAISQIMGRGNSVGLSDNQNLDVQYALVAFAGGEGWGDTAYNDAGIEQTWTSDIDTLYSALPSTINYDPSGWGSSNLYGGGTNYQAGFRTGKEVLQTSRDGALKVVIFISDGGPGYYYTNNGATTGEGSPKDYYQPALQAAVTECQTLSSDYFYFVGVTDTVTSTVFASIENAVQATNKDSISANSPEELLAAFNNIQSQITFFEANNVTMTDPLSDYADLVPNADGTYSLTVKLEKRDNTEGEYNEVDSMMVTVGANDENGSGVVMLSDGTQNVSLTVFIDKDTESGKETILVEFADDYRLAQNYRYTVSTTITPSQKAIDATMDSNEAKQTPDGGTGTHADKSEKGFWSNDNDNAKVTFDAIRTNEDGDIEATDRDKTANFPKPVIQVPEVKTGSLTIKKAISGIDSGDEEDYSNTIFTFIVEKVIPGENDTYHVDESFTNDTLGFVNGKKENVTIVGAGSYIINDLPAGWYRVTENIPGQLATDSDYEYQSNDGPAVVEVKAGGQTEATITNTYKHKDKVLTVTKTVTGNMSVEEDSFQFTLKLANADGTDYTGPVLTNEKLVKVNDDEYTFTLTGSSGSNSIQITLPHGVKATVTETDNGNYTKVESRGYETGSSAGTFSEASKQDAAMSVNYTIEFRNTKELVGPPTGLDRNDTPYTLIITAAGLAGLALIGSVVARRVRRRREE